MENAALARIFHDMADLSEIRGDNAFRIRALRNAAAVLETLTYEVAPLCSDPGKLREIRGIGEGLAQRIIEICATGSCAEHRELLAQFPPTLLELLQVEGVGPKKARLFHQVLG